MGQEAEADADQVKLSENEGIDLEDVLTALCIDARQNPDTFNAESLRSCLEAAGLLEFWDYADAADDDDEDYDGEDDEENEDEDDEEDESEDPGDAGEDADESDDDEDGEDEDVGEGDE